MIDDFMMKPDIKDLFDFTESGVTKVFKFYCKKQKH